MSRELFERLKPYIQSMLDAQQSNPGVEPPTDDGNPDPVPYIYSALEIQDNETNEWHRLFMYDGKVFIELAPKEKGGVIGPPPTPGPDVPPPGWDGELQQTNDIESLDNSTTQLTTVRI